jgi:Mor family transcriptional regulator
MITIASDLFEKEIDFFQLIFIYRYSGTLLPDVFDVMLYLTKFISKETGVDLGLEETADLARRAMLRFIDIFSGCNIEVPSKDQITRCIRDVDIYLSMTGNEKSVRYLVDKYGLTEKRVKEIFAQAKMVLERRHKVSVKE